MPKDALLLCDDGCRHGRGEVVDDYHYVGLMLLQIALKRRHHLPGEFIQVLAHHIEEYLWRCNLKIVEERRLQRWVILTACIHQGIVNVATMCLGIIDGPYNGSHLDEIRACARYDTDIHD